VTPPLDLTYEVEILINLQLKGIEFVFIFVVIEVMSASGARVDMPNDQE